MKLLMITGDRALAEGKRGAFYNTIEEFHKHWERIDIISPKVKSQMSDVKSLFGNVYIHSSNLPLILQPWFILKKGSEIYKREKFDLMTVHEYPPFYNGIGARLLWRKIKVPYILEIFHISGYPEFSNPKEFIYRYLMQFFISYDAARAKTVRIMNADVGKFLESSGIPRSKLTLIPAIYADLDVFKPMVLPKEYDLILIGRLEPNKGVELFLDVVKKMNCRAIIVGDGSLLESLRPKVKGLKLENNFIFRGWAKDSAEIAQLINKSKILIMPSYNEGGPRVVIEALACGVPILATPVGIVPDLFKNNSSEWSGKSWGKIIDWDAEDIAKKAKNILENYETYKNSGLEVARQFERKEAIKNYAEQLKRLITNN